MFEKPQEKVAACPPRSSTTTSSIDLICKIGVLINKQLNVKIRVLDVMSNCRCASVHCVFPNGHSVVLCIVYFPCASLAVNYDCELTECLGFIEACLNMVDHDSVTDLRY